MTLSKRLKNIAVEFIVLIFIMGFFSSTVSNFFLPDIYGTKILENHDFQKSIPINGTIQANEIKRVVFNENIVIREFFVDIGDTVNMGDPVFEIDKSYGTITGSTELREYYLAIENEELNKEKTNINLQLKEKDIHTMEESIKKEREDLDNVKALFEIGSISQSEFNRAKDNLKNLEEQLEMEKENYEIMKKEAHVNIKNIENNIANIRRDIKELNADEGFYSKISSDGIYYAEVDGTILSINDTGQILGKESLITEIAVVEGYDTVKFVAYVDEKDDEFINLGDDFTLEEISKDRKLEAKVTNKSRIADGERIKVEAKFNKVNDITGSPLIGGRLEGRISKEDNGDMVVPKAAIVPFRNLEEGQQGVVYIVEEKEGLLGKKYFAKQVTVSLVRIGDDKVEVTGLEQYSDKSIITNLSYKIRDGVKIKWQ